MVLRTPLWKIAPTKLSPSKSPPENCSLVNLPPLKIVYLPSKYIQLKVLCCVLLCVNYVLYYSFHENFLGLLKTLKVHFSPLDNYRRLNNGGRDPINCRNSHRRCSIRKDALRNFTKFTGKHLCQSLFFNKVAGRNTFFTKYLWATGSKIGKN